MCYGYMNGSYFYNMAIFGMARNYLNAYSSLMNSFYENGRRATGEYSNGYNPAFGALSGSIYGQNQDGRYSNSRGDTVGDLLGGRGSASYGNSRGTNSNNVSGGSLSGSTNGGGNNVGSSDAGAIGNAGNVGNSGAVGNIGNNSVSVASGGLVGNLLTNVLNNPPKKNTLNWIGDLSMAGGNTPMIDPSKLFLNSSGITPESIMPDLNNPFGLSSLEPINPSVDIMPYSDLLPYIMQYQAAAGNRNPRTNQPAQQSVQGRSNASVQGNNRTSLHANPSQNLSSRSTPSVQSSQSSTSGQNLKTSAVSGIRIDGNNIYIGKDIQAKIQDIADTLKCDFKDLCGMIYCESAFNTTAENGSAIGLIQFTEVCRADLKQAYGIDVTKDDIRNMSALEQLDLAKKALIRAKKVAGFADNQRLTAGDLYAMNFRPAYAQSDIVARRGEKAYHNGGNDGLDKNKDGRITKDELGVRITNGSKHVVMA